MVKSAFCRLCFGLSVVKIAIMSTTFVSSSFVHASNGDEQVSICGRLVVYVVLYNKIVSVSFTVRSMLGFSVLLLLLLSGVLLVLFVRLCVCVCWC